MPRLTTAQVKKGLFHPDVDARSAALHYFSDDPRPDPTVLPLVIEAIHQFGRSAAFSHWHKLQSLALTADTLRWAIGELTTALPQTRKDQHYQSAVGRMVSQADVRLLNSMNDEILAALSFDPDLVDRVNRRVALLSRDPNAVWTELEQLCRDNADVEYGSEFPWVEACHLIEALGRHGDRFAPSMMAVLEAEVTEFEDNPQVWMEMLMARLAGELRHEPAVPLLVRKIHIDSEMLNEEALTALVRIGTVGVIEAVRAAYPAADWTARLFLLGVLGRVYCDSALQAGMDLAEIELDADLLSYLIVSVVSQLSTEGNEFARAHLRADPDDYEVLSAVVPACALTGQDFPELPEWQAQLRGDRVQQPMLDDPESRVRAESLYRGPEPLVRFEPRVGRNDPCPCGSGKKFKKCCLDKAGTT